MTTRTTTNPEAPMPRLIHRKGVVTHGQALGAILGALLAAAGAIVWTLERAERPAASVKVHLLEHIDAHRGEVRDLKQEVRDGRNDLRHFMRHVRGTSSLPAELTQPLPEVTE